MWSEEKTTLPVLAWRYLRQRLPGLVLLVGCILVCTVVFFLYRVELGAVGYAALLCLVLCAIWYGVGLAAYVRRHRALEDVHRELWVSLDRLPAPMGPLEGDYQDLLREFARQAGERRTEWARRERDLTDYYGTWAHQIKTPIAAMHLLLREEKSDLSGELTAELLEVEQYVEMVLGYLRLGGGSSDFVFRTCPVDEIIRRALRRFAPQFIRKKLAVCYEGTELTVVSDEKWLLFCVEQILSNAIKYTAAGAVTICTEGTCLVISDTGMGIAPEDLPRIFEKGFTGYNGRIDQKSTGIGLYLCRSILDRLGHEIAIQSAVGQGVTVRIDLSRRRTVYE